MARSPKPRHVTHMCATGKHTRCFGSVYVYPLVDGERTVPCECPVDDCGHGTDYEKQLAKAGVPRPR